jgi:hypothetical protein
MTEPRFNSPAYVESNRLKRAQARRPQPCGAGIGRGLICGKYPAVLYPCGRRCVSCAAAAGLTPVNHHRDEQEVAPA